MWEDRKKSTYSYFALGFNSQGQHTQSGCFVPRNAIGRRGRQAKPRRSHSSPRGRNSTETLIMGLMKWVLQAKHYGNVGRGRLWERCPGVWREQEESGFDRAPVLWQTCYIHSTPDRTWNSLRDSHCFYVFFLKKSGNPCLEWFTVQGHSPRTQPCCPVFLPTDWQKMQPSTECSCKCYRSFSDLHLSDKVQRSCISNSPCSFPNILKHIAIKIKRTVHLDVA